MGMGSNFNYAAAENDRHKDFICREMETDLMRDRNDMNASVEDVKQKYELFKMLCCTPVPRLVELVRIKF